MTAPGIGLVGCGGWGQLILRDLKALGARVSVVARTEASIGRAQRYGADAIVDDIERLPTELDGIVVAAPTDMHGAVVEALLPRGSPIFVEKPMTDDLESARRIVDQAGDRVFVMDKWRYHPGVEALRELVQSGRLGRPIGIRTHRWGWSMSHGEVDAIWLLAPHDLAIVHHILGRMPEPVQAVASILGPRAGEMSGFLVSGDTTVRIDISSMRPLHQRGVVVTGEAGSAELGDSYADSLVVRIGAPGAKAASEEKLPLASTMPLEAELRCFLDFLAGGPPPMSSAAEGLAVVETIFGLRRLAGLDG